MSRIFDALQRSESEQSGTDSTALPQGPELLRRTERRVASNWETAESPAKLDATKVPDALFASGPEMVLTEPIAVDVPAVGKASPERDRSDLINRFQSLPISLTSEGRLVCLTDKEGPTAESLRLLAVRLRDLRRARPLKKILITSTIPEEGKSTVAANLACALAHSTEEKILLMEGDLRRPSLLQMFGVKRTKGICEMLKEESGLAASIYRLEGAGLWILPAGGGSSNPLEVLQSPGLPVLMRQIAACFDWVIIDSPPVLPLADTSIWMRLADGILLVTRQGTTQKQQLEKGLEAIDNEKLLGAVLNGTVASAYSGYYYRTSSQL